MTLDPANEPIATQLETELFITALSAIAAERRRRHRPVKHLTRYERLIKAIQIAEAA